MDANVQFTINSFRQLFPDKIFSLTFPWLLVKSLTFPWQLSNSLTFPGLPASSDKWSPWLKPEANRNRPGGIGRALTSLTCDAAVAAAAVGSEAGTPLSDLRPASTKFSLLARLDDGVDISRLSSWFVQTNASNIIQILHSKYTVSQNK